MTAPLQGVAEQVQRRHYILRQSDLSEIECLRKMKRKEVIAERLGSDVKKLI